MTKNKSIGVASTGKKTLVSDPLTSKSITIENPLYTQSVEQYSPHNQNLRTCLYWIAIVLKDEIELSETARENRENPKAHNAKIIGSDGIAAVELIYQTWSEYNKKTHRESIKMFPN